jgi:hypothetical protein
MMRNESARAWRHADILAHIEHQLAARADRLLPMPPLLV